MSRAANGPWFDALERMDAARHRVPFWWWLTYDALVGVVIAIGVEPWSFAMWLGYAVLGIAVVIDTVEFLVKRPGARAVLDSRAPHSQSEADL